jgi:hypothetical protein
MASSRPGRCRQVRTVLALSNVLPGQFYQAPPTCVAVLRVLCALRFVHKLEKATKTSPTFVRSAQLLVGALVVLHWIACLFCFLARMPGLAKVTVKYCYMLSSLAVTGSWYENYAEGSAAVDQQAFNDSQARIYLHAFYWTLDTASTRGSGDVVVTSDLEMGIM